MISSTLAGAPALKRNLTDTSTPAISAYFCCNIKLIFFKYWRRRVVMAWLRVLNWMSQIIISSCDQVSCFNRLFRCFKTRSNLFNSVWWIGSNWAINRSINCRRRSGEPYNNCMSPGSNRIIGRRADAGKRLYDLSSIIKLFCPRWYLTVRWSLVVVSTISIRHQSEQTSLEWQQISSKFDRQLLPL